MPMPQIITTRLECGLVLVAEPIAGAASVSLDWRVPVGTAGDPAERDGESVMLSELLFRGAGGRDSRQLSDALDRRGVRRFSRVTTHRLQLAASLVGARLAEALPLLIDLIRAPALPAEAVDPVRSLCLQALEGLRDEPQQMVMIRLSEAHRPPPFNRSGYGRRAALERITPEELVAAWRRRAVPEGSILAVAGAFDPEALARELDRRLADWKGTGLEPQAAGPPDRGYHHHEQETSQVHLALAYDAPPEAHEHSMLERLATAALGGSTSGRLFTEVRQKRSLSYSVSTSYSAGRDEGLVTVYAGTSPERAQETLEVCLAEIDRLFAPSGEGLSGEEFDRAVIGLKSRLVMQGESTPARAAGLAGDQFRLGRARGLAELTGAIDAITLEALNGYLAARKTGPPTVVSIGPAPLRMPEAVESGG